MLELIIVARYSWISISTPFIQVVEFLKNKNIKLKILTDTGQVLSFKEVDGVSYEYYKPLFSKKFPLIFLKNFFCKMKIDVAAICFDPASLIFAYYFRNYKSYYYISLELLDLPSSKGLKRSFFYMVEFLESIAIKECKLVIVQSQARGERLKEKYQLDESRLRILPNSSAGKVIKRKSTYLRDKYKIQENKKIILFMGSLINETCLFDFLRAISTSTDNSVFVFHGWFSSQQDRNVFLKFAGSFKEKIILSEELLDNKLKYELIKSADIGCVFFKPTAYNYALGLGSAGKLFDFMRCGVPVLANDSLEGNNVVKKQAIGALTNFFNLDEAITKAAMVNSERCYEYFETNEFTEKFSSIYSEILKNEK